jgi:hypothetical protein
MKTKMGGASVALTIIGALTIAITGYIPGIIAFKSITRDSALGVLIWLFIVALFIERAVEVIVSTIRDAGADSLQHDVDTAQEKIDAQAKVTPGSLPYLDPLHVAQKKLLEYRSETKELALGVGFLISIFVSLAGVRALGSIVQTVPPANWSFSAADVIVTGAVLAGGTDAIHQMMNVVMNFFDNAADKAKGGN